MKTIITLLFVAIAGTAFSSKYEETMKTNIDKLYTLSSSVELQALGNQFERIGNAEPNKWLPDYYAAYCFIRSTFFDEMDADAKHEQLDKAQEILDKLLKSNDSESEVHALQALLFQLRITDMTKGAKYSKKSSRSNRSCRKPESRKPTCLLPAWK